MFVAASTKTVNASASPVSPFTSSTIVSYAGLTPLVGVGSATRRARCGCEKPGTVKRVQPVLLSNRAAETALRDTVRPMLAAAVSHACRSDICFCAASAVFFVTEEETYATFQPPTLVPTMPMVTIPSWVDTRAGRFVRGKVCRKITVCPVSVMPLLSLNTESLTN